jgi:hypothetical protein
MNSAPPAYFRRATLVHHVRAALFRPGMRPGAANLTLAAQPLIHHLFDGWIVPCTAVDSTFQVLLRFRRNDIFWQAQTTELI